MRKYILFFAALLVGTGVKAQSGYNYYEWGLGADAFYERGYTNITTQYNHIGFDASYIYNYNPYLPIALEVQKGTLSGGGPLPSQDPYGRQYNNNYKAIVLRFDVQLGAIIDYGDGWFLNAVKGFYLGSGVSMVFNDNTVVRYSIYNPAYEFPGGSDRFNFGLPIRGGYEIKIYDSYDQPAYAIDLGYIHSFVFGEGLDGYDDPPQKFKNLAIDQYRQIVIGFKYYFGNTVSYNKLVRPFEHF